jgi:CRISPR-associated protein Cmr4
MFKQKKMLYLTVETPLHAGTGRGLGAVDLPIQRERTTGYPMAQASGIKGCLRAEADPDHSTSATQLTKDEFLTIFGPETNNAADYAGALSVGDARLLFFPVRSLAGVFAWVTSLDALSRFQREAGMIGLTLPWSVPDVVDEPKPEKAWLNGSILLAGGKVVLEEFSFEPDTTSQAEFVKKVGEWAATNVLPTGAEYAYWRKAFPEKLCILPENAFRDFVLYGLEVQTHIKLTPETKTVASGALWTSESLPVDSILYVPLLSTDSRNPALKSLTASDVFTKLTGLGLSRIQMGGDETTGQGLVALRFS